MKILGVIPARGGSKSILRKNIKLFACQPLIYYSILQARESKYINRCIVTTDDEEIRDISKQFGAEVPFLRPKEISGDLSTDLEFFQHLLQWIHDNEPENMPDILVQLRPTYPTRNVKIIDECIQKFIDNPGCDCVRTVALYEGKTPFKMYRLGELNGIGELNKFEKTNKITILNPLFNEVDGLKEPYNLPRQYLPDVYIANGYIDVISPNTILEKNSVGGDITVPYIMDSSYIEDIDTIEEWKQIENNFLNK